MILVADRLRGDVRRGLLWSSMNSFVLRAGSLLIGIALARLLTPEEFGVYAVALTVQLVLITMADLGLGADLIRSAQPDRRAPTVASLGLLSGVVLAAVMMLTAKPLAALLGSPESSGVITVLATTLVLAGAGVVPYAMLNRNFQQKRLFVIAGTDFLVGGVITVSLVLLGWGIMALAVGRVVAQAVALVLQFVLSGTRPRYGIDRSLVGPVLAFGLPLALANLLSWALLGADKVVIARLADPVMLGFYVLAFNISTWPMSGIGQAVRSVALPGFARLPVHPSGRDPSLAAATALAWTVALPAGVLLAALAAPLVTGVYGQRWAPAAPALAALGFFGAFRVLFDLMAAYLMARGRARSVLWIQVLWIGALVPALVLATGNFGISGAGWAHVVVAVAVVLPAYLLAARGSGADIVGVLNALWPPLLAAAPGGLAALAVSDRVEGVWLSLLAGGSAGTAVYAACLYGWVRRQLPRGRADPRRGRPGPLSQEPDSHPARSSSLG